MIYIDINPNFGENTQFLGLFVFTICIVWFLLVVFSYKKHGWKKTCIYFLPMILAALFIESAGVASGRYYYPGYFLYLSLFNGPVPISIVLAWSANLFLFMSLGKKVINKIYDKKNLLQITLISIISGLFGVFLDLLEDPIAHHNNWWVWQTSLDGVKFFEVPLLNFVGWFVLLFFMTFATILIERSRFTESKKVLISISSVSITGVLIFIIHGFISRIFSFFGIS